MNYYNEFDPFAADWIQRLIDGGEIPAGTVDRRSIKEVQPDDLQGYNQCHFFCGIAGWPVALRLAGWDGRCWTGSCPCQPFSTQGYRKGINDPRHLWPEFFRLISACKPPVAFGEQVARKDGFEWLAGVRSDLESAGYEVGAADLCAAGVGAPHARQRIYWVAHTNMPKQNGRSPIGQQSVPDKHSATVALADSQCQRSHRWEDSAIASESVDAKQIKAGSPSFWSSSYVIECSDGKARRCKPGIRPLANGVSRRMGKIRGGGNAIVPQVAAEFISAFMECCDE